MAIYAVHSPALVGNPAAAFDRAKVLRLGFAAWGFVFAPLWLLFKRLWLALGAWILGAAVVGFAIAFGLLRPGAGFVLYGLAALFIGIEGRALQGWALARRGLPLADIVAAADSETAEREFLARALAEPARGAASAGPAPPSAHEIIGLFPWAGR
jgi:Protein of unknown function (DUF2628)